MSSWIPGYLAQPPYQSYDDYVDPTMPDRINYLTDEEYAAAMEAWAYDRGGGAAFAPPTVTTYQRDDGSTGEWYSAGTTGQETVGEYNANLLNNKWLKMGGRNSGLAGIGLQSWIALHPEEVQAAIMAVHPVTGAPLLDRGLINWLLELGVQMPVREAPPAPPYAPPPTSNVPPLPPGVEEGWHWDGQRWIWVSAIGGEADWDTMPDGPPASDDPRAGLPPPREIPIGGGPADPWADAGGGYDGPGNHGETRPGEGQQIGEEINRNPRALGYGLGPAPMAAPELRVDDHERILNWLRNRRHRLARDPR